MNVERYYDAKGNLISFRIKVYCGKDSNGKEIRKRKTIKIPLEMKPSKIESFISREAILFEQECKDSSLVPNNITFEQYAKKIMLFKESQGLKHSTLTRYYELLERINCEFGNYPLSKIKPMMLNEFYIKLASKGQNKNNGKGLSAKTIKEHHNLISLILEAALEDELIKRNPARKIILPKRQKTEMETCTHDDIQTILFHLKKENIKWRALITLYLLTGCRRGEGLGLHWDDINMEEKLIHIHRNLLYTSSKGIYEDTPKTKSSIRFCKIPEEFIELLKELKKQQEAEKEMFGDAYVTTDYIFTKKQGGPMHPDSVTDYLKKFSIKYKTMHLNPHLFRHSAASLLIADGIDAITVSEYLGHSNPTVTTSIYAHAFAEKKAKASQTLGNNLLKSHITDQNPDQQTEKI